MKKILVLLFSLILFGCDVLENISSDLEANSQLTGYATFINSDDHSDINVELAYEGNVVKSTTTDSTGSYSVDGLIPGDYTVTVSSIKSKEKSVYTNVVVESSDSTRAPDIVLTAIGHISGRVTIDNTASGNLGVVVFVAGTSYVAMTDDAGDFVISDVPVANGYSIVISKDSYMIVWDTVGVSTGNTTNLDTYDLSSSDFVANTGESAYDIWLALGNEGSELDFIMSLQGSDGIDGTNGTDGLSAYETWLALGNEGSELDFIMSLQGSDGLDGTNGTGGLSAYETWLALGNEGSELDFITSLQGSDATDGLSTYEIWLTLGNEGTEQDFIDSLTPDSNVVSAPYTFDNITEFYVSINKVLLCPTPGATIIYTIDGSIPSVNNGEIYIDGVEITESVTLKAVAIKEGFLESSVSEFSITKLPIPVPTFSHQTGWFDERFELDINALNNDMEIYVTYDGSIPSTDNFYQYSEGSLSISILGNKRITAVVYYMGEYSNIITMEYSFPELNVEYVYKVSFNAELNDSDYAPSATLVDNTGALVAPFAGAMALGQVISINQETGFYGNGSIRYIHNGANSWGGIFTNGMTGVDLTNMEYVLVAVRGGFDPAMGAIALKLEGGNGSVYELNLLNYPYAISGEWVEYVVPLTEFVSVEFDSFSGIGLWNPKSGTDITFEDGYLATDVIVDFAFR